MRVTEFSRASFSSRLIVVLAFTLFAAFTALTILDNREFEKILPRSPLRSLSLLFGYSAGILALNYALAHRGRNLTHWATEALIAANFVLLFSALTLPYLFPSPTEASQPWWRFWDTKVVPEPNLWLHSVALLHAPLLRFTVPRVKAFFGVRRTR